jgi:hypothetical protein
MTYQEKRAVLLFVSTLIYLAGFILYKNGLCSDPQIDKENIPFWSKMVLIVLGGKIVLNFILMLLFTLVNTIVTKERTPTIKDELDIAVEHHSLRNAFIIFMSGFLFAMIIGINDFQISTIFSIFIISFLLAEIVSGISQIYFYRRGV